MKTSHKILITIILAVLAVLLFGFSWPHRTDHRPTEGHLKADYLEYNEKYFYGGLPTSTEIKIVDLGAWDHMAEVNQDGAGKWHIRIDAYDHPTEKQADMSVIHEMCHIEDEINKRNEGLDSHSGPFQACMVRVADLGGFTILW